MNMYTSLNGIWKVEMPGPSGWESTGTAFLEDGKYWAASENHYMVGNYEVSGNRIEITATGEQRGQSRTVFGKKQEKLDIKFKGKIDGDVIEGECRDNASAYEISFQITRLADLP